MAVYNVLMRIAKVPNDPNFCKPLFVLEELFAFSFSGSFLSVFLFFVACPVCEHQLGWWTYTGPEIERLRTELQRSSLKQKEDIPELTSGYLEEFVREERVT